jgi:transcriptional regulator with XRE-family HTH domain
VTLFEAGTGQNKPGQTPMSPKQFRRWRKSLGLKQKEAAEVLGLKKRMIQYYEKGERDGKKINIPKYVRLACYAVGKGIQDFDGEKVSDKN